MKLKFLQSFGGENLNSQLTSTFPQKTSSLLFIYPAGVDFEAINSTVAIKSSENVACTSIPIIDNKIAMEPNRTFVLAVDPPRGVIPPSRGRVTIQDDDSEFLNNFYI